LFHAGWLSICHSAFGSTLTASFFSSVLFVLTQKEPKRSRPKDASTLLPPRHLAFGPSQRALFIILVATLSKVSSALARPNGGGELGCGEKHHSALIFFLLF
jgi:hypothetical protein